MWAEKVLRAAGRHARAPASCSPARCCASCGCASRPTRSSRCAAPAQAIDRVHDQVARVAAGRAHRARGRPPTSPTPSWPRDTCGSTSSSSASGPNGASPHHELSDRVIEAGDPVVVDIGGTMPDGYCSDSHPHLQRRGAARASSASTTPSCWPRSWRRARASGRCHARERRRRRPRRHRSRRLRRALHPPHRPRHRPRDARGPVHRRGQHRARSSRAWRSRSSRASTCRAGTAPASRTSSSCGDVRRRAREHHHARAGGALMASTVERQLPSDEARDLLELTREIADAELAPAVASAEHEVRSPGRRCEPWARRGCSRCPTTSGSAAADSRTRSTCRCSRRSRTRGARSAIGVSVHTLACFPLATYGTAQQREGWLPDMLSGELLGAYCLSEPQSGSDAAALQTRADGATATTTWSPARRPGSPTAGWRTSTT